MIKRTSKKIASLTFVIIFLAGCAPWLTKNRFEKNANINSFSFGLAGYDDYQYCKKLNPNFISKYSNGVNPTRTCTNYQYYTCHVAHYCKGDKDCENDAAWWLPRWSSAHGDAKKEVEITKRSCEAEKNNCNQGLKNDVRCRNLSSEKYQKIIKENQSQKVEVKK